VVKLTQTLFFNLILRKILRKKIEKTQNFEFFLFLFGLFCALKTSTTDLVHFYDIITAENVGTTIPLNTTLLTKIAVIEVRFLYEFIIRKFEHLKKSIYIFF
jgi:hypothetical protein